MEALFALASHVLSGAQVSVVRTLSCVGRAVCYCIQYASRTNAFLRSSWQLAGSQGPYYGLRHRTGR